RKQRGDYPTPPWLVERVVDNTVPPAVAGRRVTVLDPACGDGRFLVAAARRLEAAGAGVCVVGMDINPAAVDVARRALADALDGGAVRWRVECGDALVHDWHGERFDVIVGNPPFLSQLATATTRGGASRHGGGPYADAAAEFVALAGRLARPAGGRIGLVLPQSILASRDAAVVRTELDRRATITWSWWSAGHVFEAQVHVCAITFETREQVIDAAAGHGSWSHVVTAALDVPDVPVLTVAGQLGQRARLTANFRDQYYGLVPAVVEDGDGPHLVTSGLVDPARNAWGRRDVTFARRRFQRPTVDLARLSPAMRRWADGLLVPKVLVANQTRVVEAVTDAEGAWLPGVPVITARPIAAADLWPVAAVLTSPIASAWAWHRAAGTGLSATALRLGPRWLVDLPWPAGGLDAAVTALRDGDVVACGSAVSRSYGVGDDDRWGERSLLDWWADRLPGGDPVPGRGSHIP
ncbi:MAG: N-6 DNA methylase, partial [Ilumatobacteraceae bacterium]